MSISLSINNKASQTSVELWDLDLHSNNWSFHSEVFNSQSDLTYLV